MERGLLRADVDVVELAHFVGIVIDGLILHSSFGVRPIVDALPKLVHSAIDGG